MDQGIKVAPESECPDCKQPRFTHCPAHRRLEAENEKLRKIDGAKLPDWIKQAEDDYYKINIDMPEGKDRIEAAACQYFEHFDDLILKIKQLIKESK